MTTVEPKPVSARYLLSTALRGHRERANLTQARVAQALEWSLSKIQRIEARASGIAVTDLKALISVIGVTDPARIEELVVLARETKLAGWWRKYHQHLDRHRASILAHEACCSRLRQWSDTHIPELLQTAEYARSRPADTDPDSLRLAEEIRVKRQSLLTAHHSPDMTFLIDESALWRGPHHILDRQLAAVAEIADQPHITIRIVPLHCSTPVIVGAFTILDIADDTYAAFVIDPLGNPHARSNPQDVAGYIETFDRIMADAADPARTIDYIQHVRRQLACDGRPYVALSNRPTQ